MAINYTHTVGCIYSREIPVCAALISTSQMHGISCDVNGVFS